MNRRTPRCLMIAALVLIGFAIPCWADDSDRQMVYLHVETFPCKHRGGWDQEYRLPREMSRQACFVALHEGLGVDVRDGVLDEETPEGVEVLHLAIIPRVFHKGDWEIRLYALDPDDPSTTVQDLWPTDPLWKKSITWPHDLAQLHGPVLAPLEELSRGELLEALKAAGVRDQTESPSAGGEAVDMATVDEMLLAMDFIKQYSAVRELHRALDQQKDSPELMSRLARGYANLALLTEHHWNASSDAFGARAMMYAQRLAATSDNSPLALWTRAYVWTLIGCHHHALADLDLLKEKDAADPAEEWAKVIEPMVHCDRDALLALAEANTPLLPLARRLHFQIVLVNRYSLPIYEAGIYMLRHVPTAYDAYAGMARFGGTLAVTRTGAQYGPAAFGHFAPQSLEAVIGIPKEVQALLPTDAVKAALAKMMLKDPNPNDPFSPVPTTVATRLRSLSRDELEGTLSWSALAYLLEEETFVEAANYLRVATNATERSLADDVAGILPFLRDHRYAKYIESYRLNKRAQPAEFAAMFTDFAFVDPSPLQSYATSALLGIKNKEDVDIGAKGREYAFPDRTYTGIAGLMYPHRPSGEFKTPAGADVARMFRTIAPHSEVGIRLEIATTIDSSAEKLAEWEGLLEYDPEAWSMMATAYNTQGDKAAAIRCFEKSLDSLATGNTAIRLSWLYLNEKDYDKWESALNRGLETEDLGLEHAQIHKEFTWGYLNRGLWQKAKPHAVEEGNTWSAWGLGDASIVCEGLAEWEESEAWIRECTTNYPTYCPERWYFWCRRTGRGDLDSARPFAESHLEHPEYGKSRETWIVQGVFRLLENRHKDALESYKKAVAEPTFTCTMMVAQLSRELGDPDGANKAIANMEEYLRNLKEKDEIDAVGIKLLEAVKNESISAEQLAELEAGIKSIRASTRCAFAYFLARQLEADGQEEKALEYYRKALTIPAHEPNYATLAGARLAEKLGTSRQVDDVLDESDLWPQPEEAAQGE